MNVLPVEAALGSSVRKRDMERDSDMPGQYLRAIITNPGIGYTTGQPLSTLSGGIAIMYTANELTGMAEALRSAYLDACGEPRSGPGRRGSVESNVLWNMVARAAFVQAERVKHTTKMSAMMDAEMGLG